MFGNWALKSNLYCFVEKYGKNWPMFGNWALKSNYFVPCWARGRWKQYVWIVEKYGYRSMSSAGLRYSTTTKFEEAFLINWTSNRNLVGGVLASSVPIFAGSCYKETKRVARADEEGCRPRCRGSRRWPCVQLEFISFLPSSYLKPLLPSKCVCFYANWFDLFLCVKIFFEFFEFFPISHMNYMYEEVKTATKAWQGW